MDQPTRSKCCWECKKIVYQSGQPDYSDVTPGYPAELYCAANVWVVDLDSYSESEDSFREKILTARNCELFEDFEAERGPV